jgi:putative exosortase-associated protein (TIGR04073 family)
VVGALVARREGNGMKHASRWVFLLGTVLMAGAVAAPVMADQQSDAVYFDGMLHKLGRGVANIVTCPAELIRTPEMVMRRDGALAGMTAGIMQGAGRTLLRGLTGIFEVLTFYAEVPDDFGPLMKPEYVWSHGNWSEE